MSSRSGDPMGLHLDQRQRLLVALPLGGFTGAVLAWRFPWQLTVLCGWDVAALVLAGSIWAFLPVLDPAGTHRAATREDDSRAAVDVIMVAASVVSLGGVVAGLAHARQQGGAMADALRAVSVFTVFLSWFTVHTLFVLRYAHLYYSEPVGGVDFTNADLDGADVDGADPGDFQPDYLDFVYLAFTVGMTFQVSDTGIGSRPIRRAVVRHALLSYLFGTVIVGVAINVVGGLIS